MLVLTDAAAEVVKSVTSTPQAPDAGLRIASSVPNARDAGALQLTTAAVPAEDDQVIETEGARVFLEPHAAAYLEDKVLDAQVDGEGNALFSLAAQGSGLV
jgi:iron-sulfur cluster assembly protein